MSDDWDSVTHIGKSRSGGGGAHRPHTIKTKAELNAAMRSGDVSSQKKFGSANSVSLCSSQYRLVDLILIDQFRKVILKVNVSPRSPILMGS